jgi:predicted Zn-dependent peptidase
MKAVEAVQRGGADEMREALLDNGIRVLTERRPDVRSAAVGVWIEQGSAHETPESAGVSHLMEHLVFKGTERRSAHEIALSLESLGGSLDAYTTREHTSYQAHVLDENLPVALDVLADLVLNPRLDPVDLELEKDVVVEEIAGVEDTPDDLIFDLHGAEFWNGHTYGRPILGTRETVRAFHIDDLRSLHVERYRGRNIVLGCVGNIEHEEVVERLTELFGGVDAGNASAGIAEPVGTISGRISVARDAAQAHVLIGNSTPSYGDPIRNALILISGAFGGGMSSRLFQRIREELALAYAVYAFQSFYSKAGMAGVYVGTRPEASDDALEAILGEYAKLFDHGITDDELEQAKSHARGRSILAMESTGARLLRLVGFTLRGEPYRDLDESLARIDAVTQDEVSTACQRFYNPEDLFTLTLGPA